MHVEEQPDKKKRMRLTQVEEQTGKTKRSTRGTHDRGLPGKMSLSKRGIKKTHVGRYLDKTYPLRIGMPTKDGLGKI